MSNLAYNDEFDAEPVLSPGKIGGPGAWRGSELQKSDAWIEHLTETEIAEIDAAIRAHVAADLSMADIRPETFPLPTLGPRLKKILNDVVEGRGFARVRVRVRRHLGALPRPPAICLLRLLVLPSGSRGGRAFEEEHAFRIAVRRELHALPMTHVSRPPGRC